MLVRAYAITGTFLGTTTIDNAFSWEETVYVLCDGGSTIYRKTYVQLIAHFGVTV